MQEVKNKRESSLTETQMSMQTVTQFIENIMQWSAQWFFHLLLDVGTLCSISRQENSWSRSASQEDSLCSLHALVSTVLTMTCVSLTWPVLYLSFRMQQVSITVVEVLSMALNVCHLDAQETSSFCCHRWWCTRTVKQSHCTNCSWGSLLRMGRKISNAFVYSST